jgi:hypothetical protein
MTVLYVAMYSLFIQEIIVKWLGGLIKTSELINDIY